MDRGSFVALHEQRLVDSLMSETGLSARDARELASDVLDRAHARGVTGTDAETYAWLRVSARRMALELLHVRGGGAPAPDPWSGAAEAADLALLRTRLGAAQRVLAALPDDQREVLRLRYVDGLLPAAIAERLDLPLATVEALLAAGRGAATRALHRGGLLGAARCVSRSRRAQVQAAAGPAALVALATVSAVFSIATLPGGVHGSRPSVAAAAPPAGVLGGGSAVPGAVPAGTDPRDLPARVAAPLGAPVVVVPVADDDNTYVDPGNTGCIRACIKTPGNLPDPPRELHVLLPQPIGDAYGDDVVVEPGYVDLCASIPTAMPSDVAQCVPGSN